jgi:hypothetical protein
MGRGSCLQGHGLSGIFGGGHWGSVARSLEAVIVHGRWLKDMGAVDAMVGSFEKLVFRVDATSRDDCTL